MAVISCFALGLACVSVSPCFVTGNDSVSGSLSIVISVIIDTVWFWQIFVIDLIGNRTGTSLTTFRICTMELMLAGPCIDIPMLRPFYLRWRTISKSSALNHSVEQSGFETARSVYLVQSEQGQHMTGIELVCCPRALDTFKL